MRFQAPHSTPQQRMHLCLVAWLAGCRRRPFIKDPTSLIPQLPKPQDLRPFPHKLLLRFLGHTGSVRCVFTYMKFESQPGFGTELSVCTQC